MRELSVAIIARDKFSRAVDTTTSLIGELPPHTLVYLFDTGYPKIILDEILRVATEGNLPLVYVSADKFANTNLVWNQFVKISDSKYLMCLENDVVVQPKCIKNTISLLADSDCDVAVPIVLENKFDLVGVPHFDPKSSDIVNLSNGRIRSILDRGRADDFPAQLPRAVKHLERHCFAMTRTAVARLGPLDTQMYCRTDYDMSFQCHANGLVIKIPGGAVVVFTQHPKNMGIDRDFFDFRWNIDRVAFANARLISKWNLDGFKTTIAHAHEARKALSNAR